MMNFYIIEEKMTQNSWEENAISTYQPDESRDENDPLYPKTAHHHPPFCPLCGKSLSTYALPPLRREIHIAKPFFGDLIYSFGIYCSERFKILYEQSGLKGIEQFRMIDILRVVTHNGVRKAKLSPLPTYYLADIVVDGAIMDYKRSKAVFCPPIVPLCDYCKLPLKEHGCFLDRYSGVFVDQTRWNGNNIFELIGGISLIIVDQTFKSWFDDSQLLSGCLFIPESEKSDKGHLYDSYVKKYGQEGLRYDLD